MEQNMPVMAKRVWKIVRVAYFMLRKGISKGKILADLNFMLKRGKIAGKLEAIHNLMFHHHSSTAGARDRHLSFPAQLKEYEFSCSNTPAHPHVFHLPFHLSRRKPAKPVDCHLVAEAFDMISSAVGSPALPGFGPSPMVRPLRITDSPFPLTPDLEQDNYHVDQAAEEFIAKFYKDLKSQSSTSYSLGCS